MHHIKAKSEVIILFQGISYGFQGSFLVGGLLRVPLQGPEGDIGPYKGDMRLHIASILGFDVVQGGQRWRGLPRWILADA